MTDFQKFVDGPKTLLIAPAGYGKTYTIAEALRYTSGRQLILTHTHAGIASLKEKVQKAGIPDQNYTIETISSFAQRYVHAFIHSTDIPEQDSKDYHLFIIRKACQVFCSTLVQTVLRSSYMGIFVDEYQDCSKQQNEMILTLSMNLPLHILGDPLQGIFDFSGESVNMDMDLSKCEIFPELDIPYRWYQNGNNRFIGDELKRVRQILKDKKPLELRESAENGLIVITIQDGDLFNSKRNYRKTLDKIIQNKKSLPHLNSLLIIVPEYEEEKSDGTRIKRGDILDRVKLRSQIDYSKSLSLLEAIDDKTFYTLARLADELIEGIGRARKKVKRIKEDMLEKIFAQTELSAWFNKDDLKSKRSETDKIKTQQFRNRLEVFFSVPSALSLHDIVLEGKTGFALKVKRDEVYRTFCNCLRNAYSDGITVYEAMKKSRNIIRRVGRKISGKVIGTTLLTKGLEFDTVVVMDAHKFDCPKNLYVALTRCCKLLVIFTNSRVLNPYKV